MAGIVSGTSEVAFCMTLKTPLSNQNINNYFGLINTLSTNYKNNKKRDKSS